MVIVLIFYTMNSIIGNESARGQFGTNREDFAVLMEEAV